MTTVYVTEKESDSKSPVYHSRADCDALDKANAVVDRSLEELRGEPTPCSWCVGDFDPTKQGKRAHAKLSRMTPEEAGLSPMGERGGSA